MEADTVHAVIQKAKKTTTAKIYTPRYWTNLIRMRPRELPLVLNNFKSILQTRFQHRKVNMKRKLVLWNKIRYVKYKYA